MKIAIIGSGLAGLNAASTLHQNGQSFTIFEANAHIGGHASTQNISFNHEGTTHTLPIDLGDFMIDPQLIHPDLFKIPGVDQLKLISVPVDFSVENYHQKLFWSTQPLYKQPHKNKKLLLQATKNCIKNHSLTQNIQLFWELYRFTKNLNHYANHPDYQHLCLEGFITQDGYSMQLIENWLLPQLLCWWGVTRDTVMRCSLRVLTDSMNIVSHSPQFAFQNGFKEVVNLISEPFQQSIKLHTPVNKIIRENNQIKIVTDSNTEIFDAVIIATPPSIAYKLLANPSIAEETILNGFDTTTTTVYCHQDKNWLPKKVPHATVNFINDNRGLSTNFWIGRLHNLQPKIYLTWGENLKEKPQEDKIILTRKFSRTLPTINFTKNCYNIKNIQGNRFTWHCGAHVSATDESNNQTPSLWANNALLSGRNTALALLEWQASLAKEGKCLP